MYCDLKPSNVLLDEKGSLKLGGFGLSQKIVSVRPFTLQQVLSLKCILKCPHNRSLQALYLKTLVEEMILLGNLVEVSQ